MPEMKINVRQRDYIVAVNGPDGKVHATVQVHAQGVRDALKKAYEKVSGWQALPADDLK